VARVTPILVLVLIVGATFAAAPGRAVTGETCTQLAPVAGSTYTHPVTGVTLVRPPAQVDAGTQLVVGARYGSSTPYKSVYAFIVSRPGGSAIGEQFFSGSGRSLRCAQIGSKLQAGVTRYIQYQLVPTAHGGKRKSITYKITTPS